jgi:hypothetical protein
MAVETVKCHFFFQVFAFILLFFPSFTFKNERSAVVSQFLLPQDCLHQTQMMLGILKFKVPLPLHYNSCFDLHTVKINRQLIMSLLSLLFVLGVVCNKVEFSNLTHKDFVGDSVAVEE